MTNDLKFLNYFLTVKRDLYIYRERKQAQGITILLGRHSHQQKVT